MRMPTPYNWMNEIRDVSKIGRNTPLPPLRKLCLNIYITAPPPLNPGDGLDHTCASVMVMVCQMETGKNVSSF